MPVTLLESYSVNFTEEQMDQEKLINASYLIDVSLLSSEFLKFPAQFIVLSALKLCGVISLEKHEEELGDAVKLSKCLKLLRNKARLEPVPTSLKKKYEGVVNSDLSWLVN